MADRTDFNDMNGDIAGEVNSAKRLEEERKEKLQAAKKKLRAAKATMKKLNGLDPGKWFEDKTLEALALLSVESKPDYERAISKARKAKVGLRDLKSEVQKRARKLAFGPPYSKNGVIGVIGVSASIDEASIDYTEKNGGVIGVSASNGAGSAGYTEKNYGVPGVTEEGDASSVVSFPDARSRPCYRVYDDDFILGEGVKMRCGVYFHGIKETKEGLQAFDLWICGPLYSKADLCAQGGTDFGLMLKFKNRRGNWREWAMPMELLKGSGEEMRGELLSLGVCRTCFGKR